MTKDEDYSKMTLDELVSAEKKANSQKIITAVLIGLFVGVAIWSATHGRGFILTVGLLIFSLVIGSSYDKKRKIIQAEINRRNTGA
ncbi:hypothetical protein [Spirosoma oryzicola]|uniref:hypothetical protein n=1 Tax=Spirosoma oryzicola TaxID=2898794 RepID=UPI001E631345|nr:hypothetical protein [Spirosoma oryzicola]UHG94887.1 hypothetical protein LQ777_30130 [Spirosoma oryzicola]